MLSRLISKKKQRIYAFKFDVESISDPVLFVNSNAEVIDCNSAFSSALGWKKELIVNENVFTLSPYQIINKKTHDEKIQNYRMGQKSNFVGHEKTLPIKDANENVILCRVRILPLQQGKKGLNFLVFMKPVFHNDLILDPKGVLKEIEQHMKEIPRDYDFRQFLPDQREMGVLRVCRIYLQRELLTLQTLIVDNSSVPWIVNYIVSLIHDPRSPHLKTFKALLNSTRAQPDVDYVNIIALRLLFPVLFSKYPDLRDSLCLLFQKIYDRLNPDEDDSRSQWELLSFDSEDYRHLVLSSDHGNTN